MSGSTGEAKPSRQFRGFRGRVSHAVMTLPTCSRLAAEHWSDEQLVDHMLAHPILINRPIVATPWGARLCRPPELVLEILRRPAS